LQQYSIVRLHIKAHVLQKKTSFSQILTEPGFLRKLCHSLLLTDQTELSPTKGQPIHNKPILAFSLGWRVLATNVLPLSQPSQQATHTKFNLARKWVGPRMPKGQLSRAMESAMPLIFQPALRALQQPHKYYYTL